SLPATSCPAPEMDRRTKSSHGLGLGTNWETTESSAHGPPSCSAHTEYAVAREALSRRSNMRLAFGRISAPMVSARAWRSRRLILVLPNSLEEGASRNLAKSVMREVRA